MGFDKVSLYRLSPNVFHDMTPARFPIAVLYSPCSGPTQLFTGPLTILTPTF